MGRQTGRWGAGWGIFGQFCPVFGEKAEGTQDEQDLQTRISRIGTNFFNHRWTQIDTDPGRGRRAKSEEDGGWRMEDGGSASA